MAAPGKYFKLFFRDIQLRQKIFKRYIHHKNIYNKGNSEIGFIRTIFSLQSYMILWLFIRDIIPGTPAWIAIAAIPLIVTAKTIIYYCIGLFWDKNNLFHEEQAWNNKRDPIMKEISNEILNGKGMEVNK